MWQTILLSLLAGAMSANATPHFVKGITKEPYPNVFGGSPVSNLVAGWSGFVLAALLLSWAHADRHPVWAFASGALGVLLMGLFHALGLVVGTTGKATRRPPRRVLDGSVVRGDQPSRACMTANMTSSASVSLGGIPHRWPPEVSQLGLSSCPWV